MEADPSRILLLGATGLIGAATAARLARDGHQVIGVTRALGEASRRVPIAGWIELDIGGATRPEIWEPHLKGIDAVVNCAGVLQDGARDSTARVHRDAPAALWRACKKVGVKRVIQMSALGAEHAGAGTRFMRTKHEGDALLEASGLDWVILRPSVVLGRQAYGGSALFRALAVWPWLPRFPAAGRLSVVQLDDVAETVALMLKPGAPSGVRLELAGPEALTIEQVVGHYRRWLGWPPAREIRFPGFLLALGWKAGDLISWLGWRPPMRTTAGRELAGGAAGDHREWARLTGIEPRSLEAALAAEPASVQERWFARLYLLKPVAFTVFIAFWVMTGLVSLTIGWDRAVQVMESTAAARFAELSVIAGASADFVIAALIAWRHSTKLGLILALIFSFVYIIAGTILVPSLWADPLGPMMKVWPIIALNLVCLAILDER